MEPGNFMKRTLLSVILCLSAFSLAQGAINAQHSFENAKKPNNDELAKIRQAFFIESLKD